MGIISELKQFDKRLWTLATVRLIFAIGLGVGAPFTAIYLNDELGISMAHVGLVWLLASVLGAVGQIIGGEAADRFGRLPVMKISMLLRAISFCALAFSIRYHVGAAVVIILYVVTRFIGSFAQPVIPAIVTDTVPAHNRTKAFGLLRIGWNTGWGAGTALGSALIGFGYFWVFIMPAFAAILGLILILVNLTETATHRPAATFHPKDMLEPMRDRRFATFCFFAFIMFLLVGQQITTISVFAKECAGIPKNLLGYIFALNSTMVVFLQWPLTMFLSRRNKKVSIAIGCLLYIVGYFSLSFAPGLGARFGSYMYAYSYMLGSMVIITLAEIIFTPTISAIAANMAPKDRVGRYLGLFGLCESLCWGTGPALGGLYIDLFSEKPMGIWGPLAGLGVIAMIGLLAFLRREGKRV